MLGDPSGKGGQVPWDRVWALSCVNFAGLSGAEEGNAVSQGLREAAGIPGA